MRMFKKLDSLGEEYFYQFIEEVRPVPLRKYRHLMWGSLYAIAFPLTAVDSFYDSLSCHIRLSHPDLHLSALWD
jgi:hypothetical protein